MRIAKEDEALISAFLDRELDDYGAEEAYKKRVTPLLLAKLKTNVEQYHKPIDRLAIQSLTNMGQVDRVLIISPIHDEMTLETAVVPLNSLLSDPENNTMEPRRGKLI